MVGRSNYRGIFVFRTTVEQRLEKKKQISRGDQKKILIFRHIVKSYFSNLFAVISVFITRFLYDDVYRVVG